MTMYTREGTYASNSMSDMNVRYNCVIKHGKCKLVLNRILASMVVSNNCIHMQKLESCLTVQSTKYNVGV